MSAVKQAVAEYLTLRRGLGFKLKKHSRMLNEFAAFLEEQGALHITSQLALRWATEPQNIQQSEWAARLSVVRGFARYWSATDPGQKFLRRACCRSGHVVPRRICTPMPRFADCSKQRAPCDQRTDCSPGRITASWVSCP